MFSTLAWAWQKELPSPTHKFLLVALADMADEEHSCFPGQERIAQMIGTSVSTVRRTLKDLEEWGLITRERRRRDDGYRTSDRYFLQVAGTSPVKLTGNSSPVKEATSPVKYDSSPVTSEQAESPEESPVLNNQQPRTIKTTAPDDFQITDRMRAYAALMAHSVELIAETEMFLGFHRSNGSRFANWYAAWQKWVVKAHTWNVAAGWKPREVVERVR